MIKQRDDYVYDGRVSPRVSESRLIAWETRNGNSRGRARIRNISLNGMMLETTTDFEPYSNCILSFDSDLGQNNYIPQIGRLVWHRADERRPDKKLYGIEFIDRSAFVTERLEQRIKSFFRKKSTYRIFTVAADSAGSLLLVALVGFLVWTSYEIYFSLSASNRQLTEAADNQAKLARENFLLGQESRQDEITTIGLELQEARSIIAQTQDMLARAQSDNDQLQADVLVLQKEMESKQSEFEAALVILEEKNRLMAEEMRVLSRQLEFYSGNVESMEEAQRWFDVYKQRLQKVKSKVSHFKKQAREVRLAAQRERDRIQMVLGNNGYFVKNGQAVQVDMEKYNNASLGDTAAPVDNGDGQKPRVAIDVNFFK